MRRFLLICALFAALCSSHAQAQTPAKGQLPAPKAPAKSGQPPMTEAAWLERANQLKAKRDWNGARDAVYNAMDLSEDYSPRAFYLLGWIDLAQHRKISAISEFRMALREGLSGKEAGEARAALKRMGASEAFPKPKPRPQTIRSMFLRNAIMADLMRPGPLEWAMQTALTLAAAAIGWGLISLLSSWAARQKFGISDLKTVAVWCALLLLLRALGQFAVSFRHILPLTLAYMALAVGQFGAALFYGVRRLVTKKVLDKGAIATWGVFYTLLFLVVAGGQTPFAPYFLGLALAGAGAWVTINPWFLAGQRVEAHKRKGDLPRAVALYEKSLARPRLSEKTRFVMNNDLASLHATMGRFENSIAHSQEALLHVHAFKSAEVMPRLNMAESMMGLGRMDEALEQLAQVWHLSETKDCILGGAQWQGVVHGVLANLNYWRGWSEEAVNQAEQCLEAFPQEKRTNQSHKNLVAMSRSIKGLALLKAGDVEAGRRYLESALKVVPLRDALAFVQFALSQMHERLGDLPAATRHAQAALAAAPNYFPAHLQQANLLARQGQKTDAIARLTEVLPVNAAHSLAPLARRKLEQWQTPAAPVAAGAPTRPPIPATAPMQTMI